MITKKHNYLHRFRYECEFCKKKYKRESLFKRHYQVCHKKHNLNTVRILPPPIQNENVEINLISLNRKLNHVLELLYVQSERIKHMEKILESKNNTIRNKLKWLTEHVTPDKTFDECLLNIILSREHYNYITNYGYSKGYCDITEELIDQYKETIYAFTTSNVTYVYTNKTEKWVEFNKKHAFSMFLRIQQQLIDIAYTVEDIPEKSRLMNNAIIYGTNSQSVDIKTKIKTTIRKKTTICIETLLNRYDITVNG